MSAALPDTLKASLDDQGIHNYASPSDPSWTAVELEQAITFVAGAPVH